MANKKYILKTEKEKPQDGTCNEEHIMDIISQAEIIFENIQNNNDICLQVYKIKKAQDCDEDTLDAMQIACENSIQIESGASEVFSVISKVKENIEKYDKDCENDLENLLKQITSFEKKSKRILESILKN